MASPAPNGIRIAHISSVDPSLEGGMARVAYHWRDATLSKGHAFEHFGVGRLKRRPHYSLFSFCMARVLAKTGNEADIYLVHESAAWAIKNERIPIVVFSHGLEARFSKVLACSRGRMSWPKRLFAKVYQALILRGLRRASSVLVLNTEDRKHLIDLGFSEEKVRLFSNGVDFTNFAECSSPRESSAGPTILFNGSWIKRKGIETLVAAAAQLHKEGVPVSNWLLIGTGKSREEVLRDWPRDLWPQVTVVPHFSGPDEQRFLQEAEIFVLPSFFEGQPLSLLQAMGAGLACVTTNICGQKDLIENGSNGFLFMPGDASSLASGLKTLLVDADKRKAMGQRASQSVSHLSWENVSNEVVDHVVEVAKKLRNENAR